MDIFTPITNAECVLQPKTGGKRRTYKRRQNRRKTYRRR
jgi:hypothetical protein